MWRFGFNDPPGDLHAFLCSSFWEFHFIFKPLDKCSVRQFFFYPKQFFSDFEDRHIYRVDVVPDEARASLERKWLSVCVGCDIELFDLSRMSISHMLKRSVLHFSSCGG